MEQDKLDGVELSLGKKQKGLHDYLILFLT